MTTEFQGTELSISNVTGELVFDLSVAFEFSGWIAAYSFNSLSSSQL